MIEEFQRKSIYENIIDSGWRIYQIEKAELDWWASEMWQLESLWSPVGKIVYVTFLFEPEFAREVWSVAASPEKPVERMHRSECNISLKSAWQTDLSMFIKCLSHLRTQ